ncbi:MAG: hypothetical protein ABIK44_04205 [candidate division WOR-3 bacterium]
MLYITPKNLCDYLDADRIFYGEGRGESGICLHLPIKNYVAGTAPSEDYLLMLSVANHLIDFLLYKRAERGPENWDYDPEAAGEIYAVCGDNLASSGVIIHDKNYPSGAKLQVFLDKTFGANEVSVRWKNQLVGDERLLHDYEEYLKEFLRDGRTAAHG